MIIPTTLASLLLHSLFLFLYTTCMLLKILKLCLKSHQTLMAWPLLCLLLCWARLFLFMLLLVLLELLVPIQNFSKYHKHFSQSFYQFNNHQNIIKKNSKLACHHSVLKIIFSQHSIFHLH